MTRTLSICGVLLLTAAATAHAATNQDQMAAKMDTMSKDVSVKGCLAAADAKGLYRLTHASEPVAAMASMKAPADSMMAGEKMAMTTYVLSSMQDLKAHVGHKIDVTGTITTPMDKAPDMKDMKDMETLTLKSFTMVSAACQ